MFKKLLENYKIFKDRWNSEINEFWNRILQLSLKLGGFCIGILGMDYGIKQLFQISLQDLGVPAIIFTVCGYVLTACGAMGLAAKLTKA